MGLQTIDQTIILVLEKIKVFNCSRLLASGNRTLWSCPVPQEKLFDLLPAHLIK